jgi:methylenetetrahydrofolate reductase (NADPH)
MGRISIELVPRVKDTFIKEVELVKRQFLAVDTINIPDILTCEVRSLEGAKLVKPFFERAIPHLRAAAVNKNKPLPFRDFLIDNDIREVLVVVGDAPPIFRPGFEPCTSLDLIKKFKAEMPEVKVYAGIDQYRRSFETECDYIKEKIDAGAQGFFTQPFFDFKLIEKYAEKLEGIEVFWGLSPVTSEKSKRYWERNNEVIFPSNFVANLEWNKAFAKEVIAFTKEGNSSVYLMPIKIDIVKYLTDLI